MAFYSDWVRSSWRYAWLVAYIATIFAANWAVVQLGIVPVGFGLAAPAGVYFAGLALTFRDLVQEELGRRWTFAAIILGAALSFVVSPQFALASGLAFLLSETTDFLVYTPIRERSWLWGVLLSNIAGSLVDSALFLWLAFGSLEFLAGQLVGKWWVTLATVAILWLWRGRRRRFAEA
jgi:uncharacterized PurR-regulated membrane protein YhhQ (DUF165 family)